ncbi:uncharacterized protein C8Q71DRAFT_852387 [Rhodofomes roseus]|uniref:Structure-specific endonuclease subunit SLX4 n=1 Tax=Rhodofomes roseus TaxID=34475 RepID=A0ABQ8KXS0_9APHY|nr:uncharacterized protein C8Q71DRAFT_852387 [Rhodofomes roseus]KAH9843864.1 hypothetical protein C8Q71DRAFT_852387 [Rhodofomes roseus]
MHRTLSRLMASQPTARSRSTPVAAWVSPGHTDVHEVSDSEPEREGRRYEEKENRKRRKQHHRRARKDDVIEFTDTQEPLLTQPVSQASQVPPATQSVISVNEESSEDASNAGVPREEPVRREESGAHNTSIIDISDDMSDDPSMPSLHALLARRMPSPDYLEPPIDIPQPISERSGSSQASAGPGDSDDEQRSGLNLKLKTFAYSASSSSRSRNPSSASIASRSTSIVSVASAAQPIRRAKSKPKTDFTEEFAEADLARLLKCVSCELKWTVRKSVTQKLKHIQACAKKKALADSTVAFLLRCELAVSPPLPEKSGDAAEKAKEPGTLMETWTDGTNKKRTKRRAVPETVRDLADTRGQILDRARALLAEREARSDDRVEQDDERPQSEEEDAGAQIPPPTQAFGESALARNRRVHEEPIQPIAFAPTQLFAPSKLGVAATSAIIDGADDDEDSLPPSTQAFAPSRFATGLGNIGVLEAAVGRSPAAKPTVTYPSPSGNAASPKYPRMSPSPTDSRPPSGPVSPLDINSDSPHHEDRKHVEYDYRPEDWGFDDAYLHFDPEDGGQVYEPPAGDDRPLSPVAGPSRLQETRGAGPSRVVIQEADTVVVTRGMSTPEPAPERPTKKPRSRKGKQPASSSPVKESAVEMSEAEFEARLHDAIMQDKNLHLRVIRYEPVHFDLFVQLATDAGLMQARKLGLMKSRIRTFLDKMAIHFHGADGPGGDRTRKRHP